MNRLLSFLYGVLSYLFFLAVFLYAIAFVGDFLVPNTVDSRTLGVAGVGVAASESWWPALAIDLGLLTLFALQHSVMARPAFKRWWTRIVPVSIERSTYVLAASLALALLFWQWRPLQGVVWSVESQVGQTLLWGLFGLGWSIVLASTFMISHAYLFGLSQVHDRLRGRQVSAPRFQTPGLYRHLRHPIMIGFLVAFWSTPEMTVGHLVFAVATTGYILVALQFEERDLLRTFGDRYRAYREQVPMLLPRLTPGPTQAQREDSAPNT